MCLHLQSLNSYKLLPNILGNLSGGFLPLFYLYIKVEVQITGFCRRICGFPACKRKNFPINPSENLFILVSILQLTKSGLLC
jgi:hypothetical protein